MLSVSDLSRRCDLTVRLTGRMFMSVYMVRLFKIAFVVEFDMRCEVNHIAELLLSMLS